MGLVGRHGTAALAGALALLAVSMADALDVPPLTGRVVDLANVLQASTVDALSAELQAHEQKTGNQLAVLVLPSLDGEPLEDFAQRTFVAWKLGQKGTDNGTLFLIAINDRKVRIHVGYGLEGTLTDARSAQIIRNEIVPRFRAGDFPGGIRAGVDAVLRTIEGTYRAPERPSRPALADEAVNKIFFAVVVGLIIGLLLARVHRTLGPVVGGGVSALLAPWIVPALVAGGASLLLISLLSAMGGSRGRRSGDDWMWYSSGGGGWGGGTSGGGGGFSGGGGDSGGGGASGNW